MRYRVHWRSTCRNELKELKEAGDAGVGRLHGPGPEGLRPDDHRVRQPLGQDAPTPQEAGNWDPWFKGLKMAEHQAEEIAIRNVIEAL